MHINSKTFDLLLRRKGLTQAALAERARLGTKTVGRIRRREGLRASTVNKIAEVLAVSIEELTAPPSADLTEKAEKRSELHRVVVDLEGQAINALTITSKHYHVSEKAILSAAPLMFSILAELSLKRRRDKLEEWKDAALAAMELAPKSHEKSYEYFSIDGIKERIWDLYHTEQASIEARDLSGGFDGDHPYYGNTDAPENPFLAMLEDLSSEAGEELEFPGLDIETLSWCFYRPHQDALENLIAPEDDIWGGDTTNHILFGDVPLRDIPESLMQPGRWTELEAWIWDHPNVRSRFSSSSDEAGEQVSPGEGESDAEA